MKNYFVPLGLWTKDRRDLLFGILFTAIVIVLCDSLVELLDASESLIAMLVTACYAALTIGLVTLIDRRFRLWLPVTNSGHELRLGQCFIYVTVCVLVLFLLDKLTSSAFAERLLALDLSPVALDRALSSSVQGGWEEVMFRLCLPILLSRSVDPLRLCPVPVTVFCSLMFMAWHWPASPVELLDHLLFGLLMAVLFHKGSGLTLPVFFHIANNLFSNLLILNSSHPSSHPVLLVLVKYLLWTGIAFRLTFVKDNRLER